MTDNVIAFPRAKRGSPPASLEDVLQSVETTRKEHIEFIVDDVMSFAFARAMDEGFNLGDEICCKNTALAVESLRAALYKTVGIGHALHQAAESIFVNEQEAAAIAYGSDSPEGPEAV